MRAYFFTFLFLFSLSYLAFSQQNTFQIAYQASEHAQCLHICPAKDGGAVFTGIATINSIDKLYLTKINCQGKHLWTKVFENSSSINNITPRVIQTSTGDFLLAANTGQYQAYNTMLIKVNNNGNIVWSKIMTGQRDDVVAGIIEDRNGDFILSGTTNSFGSDKSTNLAYRDIMLAKVDKDGNWIWGKTIGTPNNIDAAFDIVEAADGGYAAVGRCIDQGTFYTFLLKTKTNGDVEFMKTFGDTLHHTFAYDIITTSDGGFAITGSTTILKNNFQDYPDIYLIKTNSKGDTLWTQTYIGTTPDHSENGSSVIELGKGDGYAVAVATLSYPTTGFVPNKHVLITTDNIGRIQKASSYNNGGSHYPFIAKDPNGNGFWMAGFTTNISATTFTPLVMRLNNSFESGCNEKDLTDFTLQDIPHFKVRNPQREINSFQTSFYPSNKDNTYSFEPVIICQNIVDTCSTTATFDLAQQTNIEMRISADHTQLQFDAEDIDNLSYRIFNTVGQSMLSGRLNYSIDIQSLSSGLHFIEIRKQNAAMTLRFVK